MSSVVITISNTSHSELSGQSNWNFYFLAKENGLICRFLNHKDLSRFRQTSTLHNDSYEDTKTTILRSSSYESIASFPWVSFWGLRF